MNEHYDRLLQYIKHCKRMYKRKAREGTWLWAHHEVRTTRP